MWRIREKFRAIKFRRVVINNNKCHDVDNISFFNGPRTIPVPGTYYAGIVPKGSVAGKTALWDSPGYIRLRLRYFITVLSLNSL